MLSMLVSVSINPYYFFVSPFNLSPFSLDNYVIMLYCLEFIHSSVNWLAIFNGDISLL